MEAYGDNPDRLVAASVTSKPPRRHPLCCVAPKTALDRISRALDRREKKVTAVWEELGVVYLDFPDEAPFRNLNTAADVAAWREENRS